MLTAEQIIDETVAYYSADTKRRADTIDGCQYYTVEGNMCAVGRCLINPKEVEEFVQTNLRGLAAATTLNAKSEKGLDALLKEEYRGHSINLWSDLQRLHDSSFDSDYWDEHGLTQYGLECLQDIKTIHCDKE